jgi:hypothetical protein
LGCQRETHAAIRFASSTGKLSLCLVDHSIAVTVPLDPIDFGGDV